MSKSESVIQRLKNAKAKIESLDAGPLSFEDEYYVSMTGHEIDLLIKVLEYFKSIGDEELLPKPIKTVYTLDNTVDIIE